MNFDIDAMNEAYTNMMHDDFYRVVEQFEE